MKTFDFDDYRHFLNAICSEKTAPRGFKALLAREAGCQASYFSQALKERVHLTEDQLIHIADALKLSYGETEYLLLSLRLTKASSPRLREFLKEEMRNARRESGQLKNEVPRAKGIDDPLVLGTYFSSWIFSATHLLTSSPEFQKPDAIAARLGLSQKKVLEVLEFLAAHGLIEKKKTNWVYGSGSFHIPKDSPFQQVLQFSRRELAMRSIATRPEESVHFSSVFTIDNEDLKRLRELAAGFVKKSHQIVESSGTQKLASICLDVFEVI